jgi:hypothetical protein
MAFITNITNPTPDSGAFDPDGNPLGINNDGGLSLSGGSVGSDSANNVYPYVESISTARHLTSIREGYFDLYNGWLYGPLSGLPAGYNSSQNSNETSPNTRTDKIDTSNVGNPSYTFFASEGPDTEGGNVSFPRPDGPCDCPNPVENRGGLYINAVNTGCQKDWDKCRDNCGRYSQQVFSGVIVKEPTPSNDPPQLCTGYFRLMAKAAAYRSLNIRSLLGGQRAGPCTEEIIHAVGANCSFYYSTIDGFGEWWNDPSFFGCGSGAEIIGKSSSEHGPNWTGWCQFAHREYGLLPDPQAVLFEPIPGCTNLDDPTDTLIGCQHTGAIPSARLFTLKYAGEFLENNFSPCLCYKKYLDGPFMLADPDGFASNPHDWESQWEIANSGTGCSVSYGTGNCNPYIDYEDFLETGNYEDYDYYPAGMKQYLLWPTGGGGPGSGDNVEPYWSDDHCDFIYSIREAVQLSGRRTCLFETSLIELCGPSSFALASGTGGIISIPRRNLWPLLTDTSDYHQHQRACISGNVPPTGTGVCLFRWNTYEDPPAWNEQSASCAGTCVEPVYDGSGEGEMGSGTCT